MKTLKIEIPKGFEVDEFNQQTGEIKFKETPKDIMSTIKTIEDVLKSNSLTQIEFDKNCKGLEEDEISYRLIKLICKTLNEGWEPDWDDSNEYKYYPWFKMSSSGFRYHYYDYWTTYSYVGSRLCFKSSKLARYAGEQFTDVYEKFMLIK